MCDIDSDDTSDHIPPTWRKSDRGGMLGLCLHLVDNLTGTASEYSRMGLSVLSDSVGILI